MQEFIMKLENILTHGRSSSTIKALNDYKKICIMSSRAGYTCFLLVKQ